MKNRHPVPAQTPEELLQDLRNLITEAEAMASDSLKEHSAEAIEALRQRFEAAQERMTQLYAGARRKVVAGAHYADDKIRENPYQSIAIAAGVSTVIATGIPATVAAGVSATVPTPVAATIAATVSTTVPATIPAILGEGLVKGKAMVGIQIDGGGEP